MKTVVLVKASWCPVCPQAEAVWRDLAESHHFNYKEIDIAGKEGEALVAQHSIMSVPTTLIDGQVRFVGVPDKQEAVAAISTP